MKRNMDINKAYGCGVNNRFNSNEKLYINRAVNTFSSDFLITVYPPSCSSKN